MSKKILSIKEIKPGIIEVKLEATKRRKLWFKLLRYNIDFSCDSLTCPLYNECPKLRSPLKKYSSFGEFCNRLFTNYPGLSFRLATEFRITSINQVVPVKLYL